MQSGLEGRARDSCHRVAKLITLRRALACSALLFLAAWAGLERKDIRSFGPRPRILLTRRSFVPDAGEGDPPAGSQQPHHSPQHHTQHQQHQQAHAHAQPAETPGRKPVEAADAVRASTAQAAAAQRMGGAAFEGQKPSLLSFPHKVWNATAAVGPRAYPKVYILPLPEIFTCMGPAPLDTEFGHCYSTEIRLPRALAESNFTTDDPAEADFFYVPAHHYCKSVKLRYHGEQLSEIGKGPGQVNHRNFAVAVLQYILKEFPFYEPKRAIWMFPHDHGFCGWWTNEGIVPEIEESIIVSFWGLKTPEIYCDRWQRIHNYGACPLRDHPEQLEHSASAPCFTPGKDIVVPPPLLDELEYTTAEEAGLTGLDLREVRTVPPAEQPKNLIMLWPPKLEPQNFTFTFPLLIAKGMLAFTPANDSQKAVASVLFSRLLEAGKGGVLTEAYNATVQEVSQEWEAKLQANFTHTLQALPGSTRIMRSKNYILYFKGDIRPEDMAYSHGVRQTAKMLFKDTPGFNIEDRSNPLTLHNLLKEMGKSLFCLAATGAGFQQRLKYSMMVGCIPIVISDDVEMEFEDILPYKDFAIRLPQHMLYLLPTILDNFMHEPGQIEAMQQRLACAWRFLSWHKLHGRALEAMMCSLQRRLYGPENVRPVLNWQTCELTCTPRPLHWEG